MKKFIRILLSIFYLEIIFIIFFFGGSYFKTIPTFLESLINITTFAFVQTSFIYIITSCFSSKVNKIINYIIYGFLGFWYSLQYIVYKVFDAPFSLDLFSLSDQVTDSSFLGNTIKIIVSNFYIIILFFLPLIFTIVFRKEISHEKARRKNYVFAIIVFICSVTLFLVNPILQNKVFKFIFGSGNGTSYNLMYENKQLSLNLERFGVMGASYLDLYRTIFGFEDKIIIPDTNKEDEPPEKEDDPEPIVYDYNNLDIDFSSDDNISRYMSNEPGSKKNEYTGLFKGKNLIYITAESFYEIGVSQELTPTLYKLVHDGFYFENFYTSHALSTIGGEFQSLTGLYADNSIFSTWRAGTNYFPYGLGNVFRNLGYNTYAYHNHYATFQDRNKYIVTQGFNNFKACYTGLEKLMNCKSWPESDVDMINVTMNDYINSTEPFMVYYMTVSGHFEYTFGDNSIAWKNRNYTMNLPYSEKVRGYLATQIELDKALEILMKKLEEVGKLDDTVFVLLADHYPYDLSLADINTVSTYQRDSLEVDHNNLIIYNSATDSVTISKTCMSIDVLPTVYNLFGVDYDSRLIVGKDILSTYEGVAIFNDSSWKSDKGTYYASSRNFVPKDGVTIEDGYVDRINAVVANKAAISKNIILNNYYKKVLG